VGEVNIGDITARLRIDATEWTRNLQAATQALQQFQQAVQQQTGTAGQGFTRTSVAVQQLSQQLAQLNQQAISQTGFLGQMSAALTNVQAALTSTGAAAQQSSQQVQRFGDTWRTAMQVAAGIGLATSIQGLVRLVTHFASESLSLAARMQDLNLTFRAIEGSGAAASRTMDFLFTTAQKVGVEFTTVAEAFRRMDTAARGTSLEGEGVRRVFEGVVSGARVLGVSSAETNRALTALEQTLTKGRLTAEEYRRQLGNAIPGALGLMAQGLGVTTQRLESMIQLGIIPAETGLIALSNAMGGLRQQSGVETIEQLSGTFNRLKNETTAWMTAIGEGLAATIQPFLEALIAISAQLRELFNIKPPGTSGGQSGGLFGLFPGPLTPGTLNAGEPQPQGLTASRSPFVPMARRIAEAQGIDPNIFTAMIQRESGFRPNEPGPLRETRPGRFERAQGLGQILPSTAASEFGVTDIEQLRQPEVNLTLSARLFAEYRNRIRTAFGQLEDETKLTLVAYNAGIGRVIRALGETRAVGEPLTIGQVLGRLPTGVQQETRPYVAAVTQMAGAPLGQAQAAGGAPAPAPQDPFAPMVTNATKILETLKAANTAIDNISTSTLNWGGQLNDVMTDQVQQAAKEFERIGVMLATQPDILARMKPEQREIVEQAAKELAILRARVAEEAQTPAAARQRIQQLREAEALQERINEQNIRDDEHRRDVIDQITRKLEQQRDAAREAVPGFEALLGRVGTFTGRPDQDIAVQARARVQQQGTELAAALQRAMEQVAQSPALRELAPDLAQRLQTAFEALPDAIVAQGTIAADRLVAQLRMKIEEVGTQVEMIGERIAGTGLDPLSAAMARIARDFQGMTNQLEAYREQLDALAKGAPQEQQAAIAQQQAAIDAVLGQREAGRERAEAQARFRLELLPSLEEPRAQSEELDAMRKEVEDMRIQRLNQQQGPFGIGRVQTRQEREVLERMTPENRAEAEQLQAQKREQERLNYAAGLFVQLGNDVGSAWTTALFSIADGTKTVSQAFEQMAQSIMRSMAQMAAQEATKAFIKLGVQLLFGGLGTAASSGGGGGTGPDVGFGFAPGGASGDTSWIAAAMGGGGGGGGALPYFQHGGVVNRPTLAMLGEAGPEAVLNQGQMNQMMREAVSRAPSAGGQAAGAGHIAIINVASEAQAQQEQAKREGMGYRVVINHVLKELSAGDGSQINRMMQTMRR
jgi:tape measure domain-containing protein